VLHICNIHNVLVKIAGPVHTPFHPQRFEEARCYVFAGLINSSSLDANGRCNSKLAGAGTKPDAIGHG
jgi:hypothetical protein